MEDQIFGFNLPRIMFSSLTHRCPACGDGTVEILAQWKFEEQRGQYRETGIYRCLSDSCDCYHVPTMPEIHR
jgi:hypothetical protein